MLKLFIVATKASYEREGTTIDQLIEAVNTCPVNTAGRPLMPEEAQLRSAWIHAVYLMLDHIGHPTKNNGGESSDIADDVRNTYSAILPDLVALKESSGTGFVNIQEFVQDHADVLPASMEEDALQMAIVSQTVKVLWYTLVVLDEERLANDEDADMSVARPQIPRGEGIN